MIRLVWKTNLFEAFSVGVGLKTNPYMVHLGWDGLGWDGMGWVGGDYGPWIKDPL